eukprot:NODE_5059_length_704_cov_78.769497_g4896_i0.p1 GENE.NODE_5059_length_704_cov_78.769497_g4896_i0~~NODE_5059_length_704_cov_78.769497_g4896_i0.p1  ORF type:complete len:188 (+),score=50.41 NODE_5059_length_704_cov_78.769497_g4896_i0:72-635(+)
MTIPLFILAILFSVSTREITEAHLLVLKSVDKENAIEQTNLTVSVNIFNVGKSPAYSIEIDDSNWGADVVQQVEGPHKATIERILPGANQTYSFVIAPLMAGELTSLPARVSYLLEPKGEEQKVVLSNTLPPLPVLTQTEYHKRTTKHYREWFIFLMLSCIPIGIPATMFMVAEKRLQALDKSGRKK